jgi:2-hydroxychromene-2-carboxylate isomerase
LEVKMAKPIQFLFDYVSPYAYLASTQIRALGERHGREVEAIPILFAGLLEATGSIPPAEIPARRDYLYKDIVRKARLLDVAIDAPATHPFNPLTPLRVTGCVEEGPSRWRLVDALYRATWVQEQRVDQPEIVAGIATEAGFDGAALVEQAGTEEAKLRLRRATDEAIEAGVFGVPTILADGQLFWGIDSLPLLERFLDGENAIDAGVSERWARVKPSTQRRPKADLTKAFTF